MSINIPVNQSGHLKPKPPFNNLGFGKYFTDHVFVSRFSRSKGWFDSQVIPYEEFKIDPAASVLHYGQALFEGMKAFMQKDGRVVLFRPHFNFNRMKAGAERLCMEMPPEDIFLNGIKKLVQIDKEWVPNKQGTALYIRPTIIGTEAFLGVRPSDEYLFFVILSPVGSYYSQGTGVSTLKIWVEEDYLRAGPGGLGATKAAANYATSLKAAYEAKKRGFAQVLWLDVEKKFVEEVGTMNVFFVFDKEVVTPALDGTILNGGIRDSVIQLLKSWNHPIVERKVSVKEILEGGESGKLKEMFGTGTAAVISPVGELGFKNGNKVINNNQTGPLTQKIYDELSAIQYGHKPDPWGWTDLL